MLKCRELSTLVATDELENVGWMRRMEIRMHLLMCGHCRRYLQQIRAIGRGSRDLAGEREAGSDQIERMEEHILSCTCERPGEPDSGTPGDRE